LKLKKYSPQGENLIKVQTLQARLARTTFQLHSAEAQIEKHLNSRTSHHKTEVYSLTYSHSLRKGYEGAPTKTCEMKQHTAKRVARKNVSTSFIKSSNWKGFKFPSKP